MGLQNTKPLIQEPYAVFTHADLTTRYRTKSLYKSIFVFV